ncbi:MAG: metal ABC transporter ATP-binding protein [Clostridiales bacterium]|nr:metal ABC transporter ATP-binding protein [Clostridiales bacterium]
MALISVQDAAFAYDGQVVLDRVTFDVNPGDYLCIVGENGSGKSTLMKGLLRLVNPVKGNITLGDGLTQDQVGYLPQQNLTQRDFPASVLEVVTSGIRGKRLFLNREDKALAEEKMELLEISNLRHRSFMELSGGQRQRVLLARALCATRKLLLLDEPTAGLDPVVARELYKTIEAINREQGIAVIMITHDVHTAAFYASSILHLQQTPLFFGKPDEYLDTYHGQCFAGGICDV